MLEIEVGDIVEIVGAEAISPKQVLELNNYRGSNTPTQYFTGNRLFVERVFGEFLELRVEESSRYRSKAFTTSINNVILYRKKSVIKQGFINKLKQIFKNEKALF